MPHINNYLHVGILQELTSIAWDKNHLETSGCFCSSVLTQNRIWGLRLENQMLEYMVWAQILVFLLLGFVTLGKLLNFLKNVF